MSFFISITAALAASAKPSAPYSAYFSCLKAAIIPLEELTIAPRPSLLKNGYSDVGAVVGATYPEMGEVLREIMPKAYILVPGYGAQGGTAAELKPFFNKDGLGAIVNSSRGIIAAYKQEKYAEYGAEGFAEAARAAVIDMKNDIASIF